MAAYAADPASQAANVKALKGEPGVLRLRVGDWRVVFEDGAVIAVIRIGPRGGVVRPKEAGMGEMVTIPREEYERLLALAEDAEDAAAVARFRARLAAGEEELVPAAVVDRLLAGESPVRVWREHRGLTQSGLARASGVQPGGGRRHRGRAEGRVGAEPEGAGGGAGGGDRRSGLAGC